MAKFNADGPYHYENIYVEDGKIIRAHYESYGNGGGGYNPLRGQPHFDACVRDCMQSMIDDNMSVFRSMMSAISSDKTYYQMGERLLEDKRAREMTKYKL